MNQAAFTSRSPSLRRAVSVLRVAALAQLGLLAGCELYDFGDLLPGSGGSSNGGSGSGGSAGASGACEYDGVVHDSGASFPSSDGCNQCFCGEDGAVGCTERACLNICGGLTGAGCPDGQFCSFPPEAQCGAADQTGICAFQPDFCTLQYDPVCGCDDQTYGNACGAASAGVSILHDGECAPSGSECSTDTDCPIPPCVCLDENGDGSCDNECPVPLCVRGSCTTVSGDDLQLGDSCGGFRPAGSPDCALGLFCQHQPGALCGAADAPGECVAIPEVCADIFDPVCGCDGVTYASACVASASQAGILDLGECQ